MAVQCLLPDAHHGEQSWLVLLHVGEATQDTTSWCAYKRGPIAATEAQSNLNSVASSLAPDVIMEAGRVDQGGLQQNQSHNCIPIV